MKSITWEPGTDRYLDQLFDHLREEQYQDRSHRLWKNYSKDSFESAVALTIVFNDSVPEVCASISNRECWPSNAYRIYNRTWKCSNKKSFLRSVTPAMGAAGVDQVQWLKENTDAELYFISRETDNWQDWMIEHFAKDFSLEFKKDNYMYLTCPNECDDSCWQRIIYNGNEELLETWKRRS